MIYKLAIIAALSAGLLPSPSAASKKMELTDEGDLNPQPLPPIAGDEVTQDFLT